MTSGSYYTADAISTAPEEIAGNAATALSMSLLKEPPPEQFAQDQSRREAQEMWVHRVDVTQDGRCRLTMCRDIGFGNAMISEALLDPHDATQDVQTAAPCLTPGDRVIQWRWNDAFLLCPSTPANRSLLTPQLATLQGERKRTALPRKGMHVHTLNLETFESRQNFVMATSPADAIDQIQERLFHQGTLDAIEVIAVAPTQAKTSNKSPQARPQELSMLLIDDEGTARVVRFVAVSPTGSDVACMTPLIVAMTPESQALTLCNLNFPRIAAAMEARRQGEQFDLENEAAETHSDAPRG